MRILKQTILQIKEFLQEHKGTITFGIATYSLCKYVSNSINKSLTLPTAVVETEKSKEYIYIDDKSLNNAEYSGKMKPQTKEFIREVFPAPIAKLMLLFDKNCVDLAEDYISPWTVLRQAYSRNKKIRLRAVESIAAYKAWNDEKRPELKWGRRRKLEELTELSEIESFDLDAQLRTLAQSIDPRTAVGLARTHDVDLRLFLPPPPLKPWGGEEIEDALRELLLKMPETEEDKCIQFFTSGALTLSDEQKLKRDGRWAFESTGIDHHEMSLQEDVELLCLKAISKHSLYKAHCKIMIDFGILQLLQRMRDLRHDNEQIQLIAVKIVSNLCLYKQFHEQIYQSGWITLLAQMSRSEDIALRIEASRGLANLDQDAVKERYQDGVFVLYPRYRSKREPEADVVFIHGILGGSFYSWRKNNLVTSDTTEKIQCWPERWLPQDLPGHRIMCVDYESSLSKWTQLCPHDVQTRTMSFRSKQLLDRLVAAGIGDRPIVWVTHSLGGLIVKHMLLDAAENFNKYGKVLRQTKGVVFFSTPHRGSNLARHSYRIRHLVFPTNEVMELSQDSPKLARLNRLLKDLSENQNLNVLSFGETQNTTIGLGNIVKFQVVPPASANPGVGEFILADTNHLNVCKPVSRQSTIYQRVVKFIRYSTRPPKHGIGELDEPYMVHLY